MLGVVFLNSGTSKIHHWDITEGHHLPIDETIPIHKLAFPGDMIDTIRHDFSH
jgi:hypothetical protein